jgi:hypothetical protein
VKLAEGDTFLAASRTGDTKHLWLIITDPRLNGGQVIIVNLTTQKKDSETTCVISPGEHPFVKHSTVVNYQDACECPVNSIEGALGKLTSTHIEAREPLSAEILKRVKLGALASPAIKRRYKAIIKEQMG